jgi:hypothetical protein
VTSSRCQPSEARACACLSVRLEAAWWVPLQGCGCLCLISLRLLLVLPEACPRVLAGRLPRSWAASKRQARRCCTMHSNHVQLARRAGNGGHHAAVPRPHVPRQSCACPEHCAMERSARFQCTEDAANSLPARCFPCQCSAHFLHSPGCAKHSEARQRFHDGSPS